MPRAEAEGVTGRAGRPYRWERSYPPGLAWDCDLGSGPVYALLDSAAARYPGNPCVDFLGRSTTYAEAAAMVDRIAAGFRRLGVRRGVRVALFLPNSPQLVFTFFAILKAGGTVVNCNPLTGAAELVRQMADSGAEMIVTLDLAPLYDKAARALAATQLRRVVIASIADELGLLKGSLFRLGHWRDRADIPDDERHIWLRDLIEAAGSGSSEPARPDEIAVLQYTGGTTGVPKAVMLSHGNLSANARQVSRWFTKAEPGAERVLAVLPLTHAFGMTAVMNFAVALGGEIVLLPRFEMSETLAAIERRRVSIMLGVPSLFHAIASYPKVSRYDLSSLKAAISGGDALPLPVQARFEAVTGCPLGEGYGLSEAGPVVTCSNPLEGLTRPGSCGLPLPGTVVQIVSLDDGTSVLPPNERGEICVKGPQVTTGYWKSPDETAAIIRDGQLHTGDVGWMDDDGFLYFTDRLKEVIVVHGYKVYPRMVEDALRTHPAVAEAAVVGIPDEVRGQSPKGFVVLKPDAAVTVAALQAHLADMLAPASVPREIEFRPNLPKSAMGKVLKSALEAGPVQ